jgi:acetoacetate decarboxylase
MAGNHGASGKRGTAALPGRLTRSKLPASMGDVYPCAVADMPWHWTEADCIVVDYATPDDAAAALLPSELSLFPAGHSGQAIARLWLATYRGGTLGAHSEAAIEIPCLYEGSFALYVPYAYADSFAALASGREVTGFPKRPGTIAVKSAGRQFSARVDQQGQRLFSVHCIMGEPLASVPLPSTPGPGLPAPFDRTLPMPEPDDDGRGIAIPIVTTRYIPGGIEPQHVLSDWACEKGTVYAAEATVDHYPADIEPLAKLPVLGILGALLFRGDMTMHGKTILQDMA